MGYLVKDQTGSWRKVSELLNQADVEFGFGTDEMKQILDQTDVSPSKASKLISIAQDDRIKHNSRIFETVSAWTTLYQATLLNDKEFSELVNIVSEELAVCRPHIPFDLLICDSVPS
jgi:hypothetical protein